MLVLLSFVMVLVATVLLVLGLLVSGDGLTLIYVSIGMSAVAAVLLIIAVRSSKSADDAASGPSALEPEPESDRERELVGAGATARAGGTTEAMPAVAPTDLAPAAATSVPMTPPPVEPAEDGSGEWLASDTEWGDEPPGEWDAAGEVDFPIADYDDLTVDEVLPLLPQLYSDEIETVEAREREGLNRREVLDVLARLRITGTEADREAAAEDGDTWDDTGAGSAGTSPIPGYDTMPVSEIVASLGGLDDAQLDAVRAHEVANKNRRTVLAAVDRRLGATPPPAAPARSGRRTASARTGAAAKRSAPAKRATAAAKRSGAAPAKKAAAKKKAATAARKATPVAKKAAAKKAAPAKKATAKKAAAKKR